MSLGAVAQTSLIEDFQYNDGCSNPPHIIRDNSTNWTFTLTGSITGIGALNLANNFDFRREVTFSFFRTNTGVNTLEGTYIISEAKINSLSGTFSFGTDNMPDLPTGDYEVEMHVKYKNGNNVSSGNLFMAVQENGNQSCASQSFSNNGEVECDLGRIACFSYQACHELGLSTNKFGTTVNLSIAGGTGPFIIEWFITENKTGSLPSPTPAQTGTTIVTKRCGNWSYSVRVTDVTTGCVMKIIRDFYRPCFQTVKVKGNRMASTELQFDLFPNPVSNDLVRVNYELPSNTAQAQLLVHNLQGQVVKTIVLDPLSTEMKIKVEGLANGLYIASIVSDGQRIANERMVISR